MIYPISESFPELSVEERLERAKPKESIISSAISGGINRENPIVLYWDETQGVYIPTGKRKDQEERVRKVDL